MSERRERKKERVRVRKRDRGLRVGNDWVREEAGG